MLIIIEFQELYTKGHILKWVELPYSIKKCLIKSINYHQGGKMGIQSGAFGEFTWTTGYETNQPFDDVVDGYIKNNYNDASYVLIMFSDDDYNNLIEFITTI